PVAAAVRSHFNECPDSHSQFCFHGTCRFLVQEDKPACVCHSGYVGTLCEHCCVSPGVTQGTQGHTVSTLTCPVSPGVTQGTWGHAVSTALCPQVSLCCRLRKRCPGWCREHGAGQEKPGGLLKGGTSCCHSETGE
ncbi:TGFA factor, partial [Leiothrix lutea]|nr:TGFA factor [Leiothrix lutea]